MKPGSAPTTRRGLSLPEILVSVSVVAILTVLAIPTYTSYFNSSQNLAVASTLLETLNTAVHRFNEGNYELNVTPGTDSNATVELAVLRTLQYRNPLNPRVGSPYIHTRWNPRASSSAQDYRIQWAGTLFTVLAPGSSGTGLKVEFNGSDMGTPFTYPSDYTMAGS